MGTFSSRPINPAFPFSHTALSLTYIYMHHVPNVGGRISLLNIAMGWSLVLKIYVKPFW